MKRLITLFSICALIQSCGGNENDNSNRDTEDEANNGSNEVEEVDIPIDITLSTLNGIIPGMTKTGLIILSEPLTTCMKPLMWIGPIQHNIYGHFTMWRTTKVKSDY